MMKTMKIVEITIEAAAEAQTSKRRTAIDVAKSDDTPALWHEPWPRSRYDGRSRTERSLMRSDKVHRRRGMPHRRPATEAAHAPTKTMHTALCRHGSAQNNNRRRR